MKNLKYILPIVIFALACTPEDLFIDVEPAEEKMVVSSQFIPDNLLVVTVTRSFSALLTNNSSDLANTDIERLIVGDGYVEATTNEGSVELTQIADNSGVYVGDIGVVSAGDLVELFVYDSLTGDTITSSTNAMPQVRLEEVSVSKEINNNDTTSTYTYSFIDEPGDNWYILHTYGINNLPSIVDDSLIFSLADEDLLIASELISDIALEPGLVTREIELPFFDSPDTVAFMLTNISEGYFRFLDARQRTGGIIASATGEPVNHPTNIENGYGYFNIHIPHVVLGYNEE